MGATDNVSVMDHALPRPLDWRWLLVVPLTLFVLLNVASMVNILPQLPTWGGRAGDWYHWGQVDIHDPYAWEWVRWSPPAVWLQATVQPWAYPVVFAANLLSLLLLPWRVALVFLLFWPFWSAQLQGSFMPMIVVAAWNALEGKRWAVVAFCCVAVLIPRPLMLPVLGVLLWRYPAARWALLGTTVFVVSYSLAVGQMDDWVARMLTVGADQPFNVSPSALIGAWWYLIGFALAGWLTWKGWYGLASLAISPYLLTYYLSIALVDLKRSSKSRPPGR